MNSDALIVIAGGTTESRGAVDVLLDEGYWVLWSQATDTPFQLRQHPRLRCRTGRLTAEGWAALLEEVGADAIVDAAHPHAVQLHETLRAVSTRLAVPLLRLRRATVVLDDSALLVQSHAQSARLACELGQRILVTVGTRNLSHYVIAARRMQLALFVRVLDGSESREVLRKLGCRPEEITYGRGPFSLERNLQLLRQINADVLVTKDSGKEGGLVEKLEAAKQCGCQVIVVARPEEPDDSVVSAGQLVERLRGFHLPARKHRRLF